MKKLAILLFACAMYLAQPASACTNLIVTRGASADSSVMVTYAADSHQLYGALYKYNAPRRDYPAGTYLPIYDWDSGRFLGRIKQAAHTYSTVGNMNEHSLIITETTFGGRPQLADSTGIIDYGSLIYITLQRARTAREAIETIVALTNEYGYASEGETFTIADPNEVWIMDLIGKGCKLNGRQRQPRHSMGSPTRPRRICMCTRQPVPHIDIPERRPRKLPLCTRRHLVCTRGGALRGQ